MFKYVKEQSAGSKGFKYCQLIKENTYSTHQYLDFVSCPNYIFKGFLKIQITEVHIRSL